jgi:hypothetical protein
MMAYVAKRVMTGIWMLLNTLLAKLQPQCEMKIRFCQGGSSLIQVLQSNTDLDESGATHE